MACQTGYVVFASWQSQCHSNNVVTQAGEVFAEKREKKNIIITQHKESACGCDNGIMRVWGNSLISKSYTNDAEDPLWLLNCITC